MSLKNSIVFLLLSLLCLPGAFARKPAVEDFVGVEPEGHSKTLQGTEVLFEFGNTVKAFEKKPSGLLAKWTPTLVLTAFLLLPFAMWFGITRSAGKVQESSTAQAQVTSLADYKKEIEEDKEDIKKAS